MSEPNSKTLAVIDDTTNDVAGTSTTVEEDTARLLSSKFISRYYLPRRKIDINHSRQCIGPGEQVSAQEKLDELIQLKTDAKQWFRHEVHKIVVSTIQEASLAFMKVINNDVKNLPVRTIEDLLEKVEQDCSDKFLKQMFNIIYKPFDIDSKWSMVLEEKYMREFNFKYTESKKTSHLGREKGCFELLATAEKTELLKKFQRKGKFSHHGRYLTIELPRETDGRYRKGERVFGMMTSSRKMKNCQRGNQRNYMKVRWKVKTMNLSRIS